MGTLEARVLVSVLSSSKHAQVSRPPRKNALRMSGNFSFLLRIKTHCKQDKIPYRELWKKKSSS